MEAVNVAHLTPRRRALVSRHLDEEVGDAGTFHDVDASRARRRAAGDQVAVRPASYGRIREPRMADATSCALGAAGVR